MQSVQRTSDARLMVMEDDNENLRIYYGAGDYSTKLAFSTLSEFRILMMPCSRMTKYATISFRFDD